VQDDKYFQTKVVPYVDGEKVKYVGPAGPVEKVKLLRHAYALLHLINFDEPFGLTVVEAMACGTPVIAIRRGAMPELVKDTVTGFLVSDWEEAAAMVKNIGRVDRAQCRAWVEERFTCERMVEDYLEVYRKILSGKESV